MPRLVVTSCILLLFSCMCSCASLIPRTHYESTATWVNDSQIVEALTHYKARMPLNPLSQNLIAGPAKTEIFLYKVTPASLVLAEAQKLSVSKGRVLPGTVVVVNQTIYYLVEEENEQFLFTTNFMKAEARPIMSGQLLAISKTDHSLLVFSLENDEAVVRMIPVDGAGAIIDSSVKPVAVSKAQATPLFRVMGDHLYIHNGNQVNLIERGEDKGKALTFPACFYPIDLVESLSPDGRRFFRDEGKAQLRQDEPIKMNTKMTSQLNNCN
ncbi:MAG: hypothetical protein H3C43_06480 [Leptonema sp. (in: Bacteria)]|nr:hypothetical protein [Leptonema sp. (in: bacteria)]